MWFHEGIVHADGDTLEHLCKSWPSICILSSLERTILPLNLVLPAVMAPSLAPRPVRPRSLVVTATKLQTTLPSKQIAVLSFGKTLWRRRHVPTVVLLPTIDENGVEFVHHCLERLIYQASLAEELGWTELENSHPKILA